MCIQKTEQKMPLFPPAFPNTKPILFFKIKNQKRPEKYYCKPFFFLKSRLSFGKKRFLELS